MGLILFLVRSATGKSLMAKSGRNS